MTKKSMILIMTIMLLPSVALAWTNRAQMNSYPSIGDGYSCTTYSKGYAESVTHSTTPNPSKSLHVFTNGGVEDAGSVFHCYAMMPSPNNTVYLRYWFKYGKNYQYHPTISKQIYFYGNDIYATGKRVPRFLIGVHPSSGIGPRVTTFWGGALGQHCGGGSSYCYANVGSEIVIEKGVWYKIDVAANFGTPGNANGWYKLWVNNVLKHNYTNVKMLTPSDTAMSETSLTPVWGGQADITVPTSGMDEWYDDLIISSEPITGIEYQLPNPEPNPEQKIPSPPSTLNVK